MKLLRILLLSCLLSVPVSAYAVHPYSMSATPITGDTITASLWNTADTDHINNNIPESIDDYSTNDAEMQSTRDPYPATVISLAETLDDELQGLRYIIAQITGKTYWYIDPPSFLEVDTAVTDFTLEQTTYNDVNGADPVFSIYSDTTPDLKWMLIEEVGGTRMALWPSTLAIPDNPHTDIMSAFNVHGDLVVGDISTFSPAGNAYVVADRTTTNLNPSSDITHYQCSNTTPGDEPNAGGMIDLYPMVNDWEASHAYLVNEIVIPTTQNSYTYKCTTAGTSSGTEPASWDTTPGQTTADGTVTWTTVAGAGGGDSNDGIIELVAYGQGTGSLANSIIFSQRDGLNSTNRVFMLNTDGNVIPGTTAATKLGSVGAAWLSVTASAGSGTEDGYVPIVIDQQTTTGIGNVGTGVDTLRTYTMPADTLAANGDMLRITATLRLSASNNKQIILKFGSATIIDSTAAALNSMSITLTAYILRTGVGAQFTTATAVGSTKGQAWTSGMIGASDYVGATEDETGAITILLTGEATTTNDIICDSWLVEYMRKG